MEGGSGGQERVFGGFGVLLSRTGIRGSGFVMPSLFCGYMASRV